LPSGEQGKLSAEGTKKYSRKNQAATLINTPIGTMQAWYIRSSGKRSYLYMVYFIPPLFLVWRSSFEAVALPDFAVGLKCESVLKMRILQDFFMHLERNCR
jgi:hypothetical protein